MLTISAIGAGRAAYHRNGPPGRWAGTGAAALGLTGAVDMDDLAAVLAGRRPPGAGGGDLVTRRARRRAGFEVVMAAPKSVSLLAALAADGDGAALAGAHDAAAAAALGWLDRHGAQRRGQPGVGVGLVAAVFAHHTNAAGEPHLHVHVVVANLAANGAGWSALHSPALWHHRDAAGAVYHLALRHAAGQAGLHLDWTIGARGAGDVAGVGRRAIDAASTRRARVLADAADRVPGRSSPAAREVARRRTRGDPPAPPWRLRVAAAGLTPAGAAAVLARGRRRGPREAAGGDEAVDAALLQRGSRFRRADVVVALARSTPEGLALGEVEARVEGICRRAEVGGGGTFVSPHAAATDRTVSAAALARAGCGAGVATATWAAASRAANALGPEGATAVGRLVGSGHGVEVLGSGSVGPGRAPLVAQAAVVDAARLAWQEAGHTVVVRAEPAAAKRWRALTGLDGPERTAGRATVTIVDRADRLATPELAAMLAAAEMEAGKVVLVAGGTSPARPAPRSAVFDAVRAGIGQLDPGVAHAGRTTGRVMTDVVADWSQRAPGSPTPLMVAAGAAEVEALNAAARQRLVAAGVITGPAVSSGEVSLQAGDRVVTLRRRRVPAGTLGRVTEVDQRTGTAGVRWTDGTVERLDGHSRGVGYGYAVTPALVRPGGPALLAVGDHLRLGADAPQVVATWRARRHQAEVPGLVAEGRRRDHGASLVLR